MSRLSAIVFAATCTFPALCVGAVTISKDTVYENCYFDSVCHHNDWQDVCTAGGDSLTVTNQGADTVYVDSVCIHIEQRYRGTCGGGYSPMFGVGYQTACSIPGGCQTRLDVYPSSVWVWCFAVPRSGRSAVYVPPGASTSLSCFRLVPCFSCPVEVTVATQAAAAPDTVGAVIRFVFSTGELDSVTLVGYLGFLCSTEARPPARASVPSAQVLLGVHIPAYTIAGQRIDAANKPRGIAVTPGGELVSP